MRRITAGYSGLSNEGDDLHLFPVLPAGQGIDLVDFVDKLGPLFSQRAPRRRSIGATKMNQMLVGLWDVDEHSGEKLERVDRRAVVAIVACFGLINEEPRFRMITKSGQVDWHAVQVASEAMESFGVAGIDRGVIVNGES